MDFNTESLKDIKEEMAPFLDNNHQESGTYPDMALRVQWENYFALEELDICKTFTMRDDGKLVGYSIFIVSSHSHYQENIFALNDVVYIDPESRGSDTIDFFNYCETELLVAGAQVISYNMPTSDSMKRLMTAIGHEHVESTYMKRIG